MEHYQVTSSGTMLCLLCETSVQVGASIWNGDTATWTELQPSLSTFVICATGHTFECPSWDSEDA